MVTSELRPKHPDSPWGPGGPSRDKSRCKGAAMSLAPYRAGERAVWLEYRVGGNRLGQGGQITVHCSVGREKLLEGYGGIHSMGSSVQDPSTEGRVESGDQRGGRAVTPVRGDSG